jgi:hypothetical protein
VDRQPDIGPSPVVGDVDPTVCRERLFATIMRRMPWIPLQKTPVPYGAMRREGRVDHARLEGSLSHPSGQDVRGGTMSNPTTWR